jgi:hypothetical protein
MHVDYTAGVQPLDARFYGVLLRHYGVSGGVAIATVRAESLGFGRKIANNTAIQSAPSGNQTGIQIEKREMMPSAVKQ